MLRKYIDLNCDMGEGFGIYHIGNDEAIMPLISSANIACGFHAGDPLVLTRTLKLAKKFGVSVGAHPGYADLAGFGRRQIPMSTDELYAMTVYQIGAFLGLAKVHQVEVSHVKVHGALYNVAAVDINVARTLAKAIKDLDSNLVMVGLAGSKMIQAGQEIGIKVASEAFADRTYGADGNLTPRSTAGALHSTAKAAARQVLQIVQENKVTALTGEVVPLWADTICLHGDGELAVEMAQEINHVLSLADIGVRALNWRLG
ncbi:MAG: 5-oxoprolinase subunit PxpA [bacterium]|nr:5-oxoprolinase subunit PxpA [bacterium]